MPPELPSIPKKENSNINETFQLDTQIEVPLQKGKI